MLDHRIATFMTLFREMNYRKTAVSLQPLKWRISA